MHLGPFSSSLSTHPLLSPPLAEAQPPLCESSAVLDTLPRLRELLGHVHPLVQAYSARCVWVLARCSQRCGQHLSELGARSALRVMRDGCSLQRGKYFARKSLEVLPQEGEEEEDALVEKKKVALSPPLLFVSVRVSLSPPSPSQRPLP